MQIEASKNNSLLDVSPMPAIKKSVPEELLQYIFEHLSKKDLAICARVCKEWKNMSSEKLSWHSLVKSQNYALRHFPLRYSPQSPHKEKKKQSIEFKA